MATKVFVGNLSFSTKAETLKQEFEKAGSVLNANIITRGPRSLGYGFVEFATPEAANKAVELLHQHTVDGRQINVEVARPRVEPDETQPTNSNAGGGRGRRQRNNSNLQGGTSSSSSYATGSPGKGRRRSFRRYSRQGQQGEQEGQGQPQQQFPQQQRQTTFKRAYRPRQENHHAGNAAGVPAGDSAQQHHQQQQNQQHQSQQQQGGEFRRRRRRYGRRGSRPFQGEQQQQPQQQQQAHPQQQQQQTYRKVVPQGASADQAAGRSAPRRRGRQPRAPRPQQDTPRLPSETTLFVANLPFATTDEELKTLFNAHAPVVSAHVVTRKNGRSKGFGFVEFGGKDDQAKALKAVDGTEYNSRTLNVNVALKVSPTDAASSSEAPTSAGVAPVANGEAKAPAAEESKGKEVDTATA